MLQSAATILVKRAVPAKDVTKGGYVDLITVGQDATQNGELNVSASPEVFNQLVSLPPLTQVQAKLWLVAGSYNGKPTMRCIGIELGKAK